MFGKVRTCVLNMPMNEGQGHPHDSSGYGNNGTNYGADWVSGDYGWSMEFVRTNNDYVNCGNDLSLNGKSNLTVSTWIKTNTTASIIQNVVTKGDNVIATGEYYLCYYSANRLLFLITNGVAYAQCLITKTLLTNKWYNFVGTYDGVSVKMYLDGVEIDSDVAALGDLNNTSNNVYIGGEGAVDNFTGNINDVHIYNHPLSATEILSYFNATKARYGL